MEVEEYSLLNPAFFEDLLQQLRPRIEASGARISMQVTSVELSAHPSLLLCLVDNLLTNALHHSVEADIHIHLDATALTVTNCGGQSAISADSHGIGLVLVKDICQRYGWCFELHLGNQGCSAVVSFRSLDNSET